MVGAPGERILRGFFHLRFTIYDLRFRNLASLRLAEMRSVSGGGGLGVAGCWFERGWIMRSCVTGLAKS